MQTNGMRTLVVAAGFVVAASIVQAAGQAPQTGSTGPTRPEPQGTVQPRVDPPTVSASEITLTGCLAQVDAPGSGGPTSEGASAARGGGFVLRQATRSGAGAASPTEGASGTSGSDASGSTSGAAGTKGSEYRLVPSGAAVTLADHVGHKVEVRGRLSTGSMQTSNEQAISSSHPSGSTGTETGGQSAAQAAAGQSSTPTGHAGTTAAQGATAGGQQWRPNLSALPTIMVSSVRTVAGSCSTSGS